LTLAFGLAVLGSVVWQLWTGRASSWSWQGEVTRKNRPWGFWLRIVAFTLGSLFFLAAGASLLNGPEFHPQFRLRMSDIAIVLLVVALLFREFVEWRRRRHGRTSKKP
jgi:hypothetical protein